MVGKSYHFTPFFKLKKEMAKKACSAGGPGIIQVFYYQKIQRGGTNIFLFFHIYRISKIPRLAGLSSPAVLRGRRSMSFSYPMVGTPSGQVAGFVSSQIHVR